MRTPTTTALLLLTFVTTPILGYGIGKRDSINPILRRSAHSGRAINVIPVMPDEPDTSSDPNEPTEPFATTDSASQPNFTDPASSGFTLADPSSYLAAHNDVRSLHGADPLSWSDELESYAQEWAAQCVLRTSGGAFGQYGENMVAGSGTFSATAAVSVWADSQSDYDATSPAPTHWSQIVWKSTTRVGCSTSICPRIIPGSGTAVLHVCFYDSPGNVNGYYSDNVQL